MDLRLQDEVLLPQEKSQQAFGSEIKQIGALPEDLQVRGVNTFTNLVFWVLKPLSRKSVFHNWDAADMNECSVTEKSHELNPECFARARRRKFARITIGQKQWESLEVFHCGTFQFCRSNFLRQAKVSLVVFGYSLKSLCICF